MGMLAQLNQRSEPSGFFSAGVFLGREPRGEQKQQRGFTMVELMIVVAIIGILASIVYPSYIDNVKKSRRAAAQSYLMEIAQRQQQYLLDARTYAANLSALGVVTPADVAKYYTIKVEVAEAPFSFTLTATPTGSQVSDGDLTLNNTGVKTPAEKW